MALKPLKLKRYVTEEEAATLLSSLIGEEVTAADMEEYARQGIVPAYMQSKSMFLLFDMGAYKQWLLAPDAPISQELAHHAMKIAPWPQEDIVEDSEGAEWLLMDEGTNFSAAEFVKDHHYTRVYAPVEICRAAVLMNDATACPEWPAVLHSQGHRLNQAGEKDRQILSYFARLDIPDDVKGSGFLRSTKPPHPVLPTKLDGRERTSMELMIFALADEAGYQLDDPNHCARKLRVKLDFLGIQDLAGDGTAKKFFKNAAATAGRAIEKENN
ncbi:hypothetical protein [Pseudomonas sp.]|uniref:hypothetical protein n=1 Tax=Pseudomonas sp. TaxID=306 RepID=UPI003C74A4D3